MRSTPHTHARTKTEGRGGHGTARRTGACPGRARPSPPPPLPLTGPAPPSRQRCEQSGQGSAACDRAGGRGGCNGVPVAARQCRWPPPSQPPRAPTVSAPGRTHSSSDDEGHCGPPMGKTRTLPGGRGRSRARRRATLTGAASGAAAVLGSGRRGLLLPELGRRADGPCAPRPHSGCQGETQERLRARPPPHTHTRRVTHTHTAHTASAALPTQRRVAALPAAQPRPGYEPTHSAAVGEGGGGGGLVLPGATARVSPQRARASGARRAAGTHPHPRQRRAQRWQSRRCRCRCRRRCRHHGRGAACGHRPAGGAGPWSTPAARPRRPRRPPPPGRPRALRRWRGGSGGAAASRVGPSACTPSGCWWRR
jgi:hypothetical protein